MISRDEVLMGRDAQFPLTPELETNLAHLLDCINKFRTIYGIPMVVNSGYRPGHFNTDAKGALNSPHLTCQAVDFTDIDRKLTTWCLAHLDVLEQCGLWMEDPGHTPVWCHLQCRSAHNRVFIP